MKVRMQSHFGTLFFTYSEYQDVAWQPSSKVLRKQGENKGTLICYGKEYFSDKPIEAEGGTTTIKDTIADDKEPIDSLNNLHNFSLQEFLLNINLYNAWENLSTKQKK
ncbi:hypothetical protein AAV35_000510 [Salimicrobium jeotgali]|uniref:Uncharacterized protein n=1 Tax=Salimicrobium jeotgali TaxID=1230341 RepID=K2G916_9BACI|nr:hypothetical protein AAV35_000510 [Salimicrobium jeotgali]EKE30877.1 hypothetical protein MJ3_11270 [Salimicrobium jeotgali]